MYLMLSAVSRNVKQTLGNMGASRTSLARLDDLRLSVCSRPKRLFLAAQLASWAQHFKQLKADMSSSVAQGPTQLS